MTKGVLETIVTKAFKLGVQYGWDASTHMVTLSSGEAGETADRLQNKLQDVNSFFDLVFDYTPDEVRSLLVDAENG